MTTLADQFDEKANALDQIANDTLIEAKARMMELTKEGQQINEPYLTLLMELVGKTDPSEDTEDIAEAAKELEDIAARLTNKWNRKLLKKGPSDMLFRQGEQVDKFVRWMWDVKRIRDLLQAVQFLRKLAQQHREQAEALR